MLNTPPHEKRAGPEVSFRSFMVPLPPLRDGGRALPIPSFRQTCLPLILDAPDCICSPGRLLLGVVQSGATAEWRHAQVISIHAPRAGCDWSVMDEVPELVHFNPRTPCEVRRCISSQNTTSIRFQSTHPVRGATQQPSSESRRLPISIHAPHTGCDRDAIQHQRQPGAISIHAPHTGCD